MKSQRTKILLSAFACDPAFGSDEEVGWQWVRQLSSRGFDVTVITRRSHKQAIDRELEASGLPGPAQFEYVDVPWLHGILKRFNRRNHIYYYVWQLMAFIRASRLCRKEKYALVHHVTWVSFRQPSLMGLLNVPFYFGPVAGGDEIPRGYTIGFSAKEKVTEALRRMLNAAVRFDPMMNLTYSTARKVFVTSEGHLERLPRHALRKTCVELAIACSRPVQLACTKPITDNSIRTRLLFVGRCISLKGLDLGLQIFAKVKKEIPHATLTIVGDGSERARWMKLAADYGISEAVIWRGWIPKHEVQDIYAEHDLLFYPSLRDSGGFVVLEALQSGIPVVCYKLGGPGVMVDDTCGAVVRPAADIKATVDQFAHAVVSVVSARADGHNWSETCKARAYTFTWDRLIERVYSDLLRTGKNED